MIPGLYALRTGSSRSGGSAYWRILQVQDPHKSADPGRLVDLTWSAGRAVGLPVLAHDRQTVVRATHADLYAALPGIEVL